MISVQDETPFNCEARYSDASNESDRPRRREAQKHTRVRRRQYNTPGPNFLWHINGWDKIKPYGFSVYACIDEFLRLAAMARGIHNKQTSKCCCRLFSALCNNLVGFQGLMSINRRHFNVGLCIYLYIIEN